VRSARTVGGESFHPVDGKTWRTICDVAGEIDAATIVLGARGLSRMGSLLLGSVSFAVTVHAKRPVLVVPHRGGG
jgi:nucleotide-binding universal stress UspA family protein